MTRTRTIAAAAAILLVVAGSAAAYQAFVSGGSQNSCASVAPGTFERSQAKQTTFGAVTEYALPSPNRWPNAITTAPDGSVWFAEQGVPGVGRLFPGNGTVVEYAWPGYATPKPPDCVPLVSASGIAVWSGRVWAADEFGNAVVGVDPKDGSAVSVNTTGRAEFPYWLAVGPDGALWFTSDNLPGQPARLGRIMPNMTLDVVSLIGLGNDQPIQLDFVNSTFALISTLNEATNSTTHTCQCDGHVYSFDPRTASSSVTPDRVGGAFHLILPTSVAYSDGVVWVAQHDASNMLGYSVATHEWTVYPTSILPWEATTLPLQVAANGNRVWFNEHYANKIALLNPQNGTLTEYSESDPPASSDKGIQNDLSIAASQTGVWFTSLSGNYVGFVDGTKDPGIHLATQGANRVSVSPGGNATFGVRITGTWTSALTINYSDSENQQSIPKLIRIVLSSTTVAPGNGNPFELGVRVEVGASVRPGPYTVAVTVTNGGIQQTAYFFVDVT